VEDTVAREGWIAAELAAEHARLGVVSLTLPAPSGIGRRSGSPRGLRARLDEAATRIRGPEAVTLRQRPVPHAYRVFFRHIGLDPDVTRVPAEAVVVERLRRGGFPTAGLLDDALTLALVETGVPVWALDADTLDGPLGLRLAGDGERLGHAADAPPLPPGRIVLADATGPLAILFGEIAPAHRATRRTTTLELLTVRVDGVPSIHVEEALSTCVEALRSG
jgi:DNA/RNA-binding domain of Phe-tRNA-synthetase-like protein